MAPLPLATIRNDLKNLRMATLELDSLYGPPAPPAAPGAPQGPQPAGRPGPHLRPSAAAATPALPAHRGPRLPQAGRRPGDRGRHSRQRQRVLRCLGRAVLPTLGVHRGHLSVRPHHDPRRVRLQPQLQPQRRPRHHPRRPGIPVHLHRPQRPAGRLRHPARQLDHRMGTLRRHRRRKARKFDTKLSTGLFHLQSAKGQEETPADAANLAVRNLLRGYGLRIPTGQAVAHHLGLTALTAAQLKVAAASTTQAGVLQSTESSPVPRSGTTCWPRPNTTAANASARSAAPSSPKSSSAWSAAATTRSCAPPAGPQPCLRPPRPLRAGRPAPLRPGAHMNLLTSRTDRDGLCRSPAREWPSPGSVGCRTAGSITQSLVLAYCPHRRGPSGRVTHRRWHPGAECCVPGEVGR
jgi:hypothetical protein